MTSPGGPGGPEYVFYRGDTMCYFRRSPCGWRWHAFVGVHPQHPCSGRRFVPRRHGPDLVHANVPPVGNSDANKTWWFIFECRSADEFTAYNELLAAANDLNAGVPDA